MLTDYRKEDVGFVFQFYNLIPDLTVAENIEVMSDIAENPLNIDEVLEAMGMEKYRYRFPKELSGGQQQRVAIARVIIKNPKLLLCDELTGALDTKSSKTVLEFIEKINKLYKATTVIITHNEAIAKMADRVIYIKAVNEKYYMRTYISAKENMRIDMVKMQAEMFSIISYIILVVMPLIVVVIVSIVINRKVKSEQKLIGILTALGYKK